jgi:hypothetical protein
MRMFLDAAVRVARELHMLLYVDPETAKVEPSRTGDELALHFGINAA